MSSINFHQLSIFNVVARVGNITKAAAELDISQPAVSLQIKQLERSLRTTLVIRLRTGIELTDTGEAVYRYAKRIFSLADEMRHAIQDIEGLNVGRLIIGSSSTPGECILPAIIGAFHSRYPKVEVSLAISNTQTVVDQILNGQLDLGMAGAPVKRNGLVSFPYANDEVVLVSSSSHPLAWNSRSSIADIDGQPFIMRESGSATRKAAEASFARSGVRVNVVMELGSNEAVKRAAAAGLGLGVLSKFSVGPDVAAGYLSVLSVEGWKCERPLTVFYRDDGHISMAQRAFLAVLRSESPLPPPPF